MKEEFKFLIGKEVWFKLNDDTMGLGLVTGFIYPFLVLDDNNLIKYQIINQIKVME